MRPIENAVALVAGGSSGIGLAIAKALCAKGAKVAITYRRDDHRDEALAQLQAMGLKVKVVQMDVTDRPAFEEAARNVEQDLGPIDIFCNSAGVSLFGAMEHATYEDWDWVFGVNVGGVINGVMTIVPRMIRRRAGGHIITVGSMAAFLPGLEAGIYTASKFAVRGMMEGLRLSLAKHKIGVSLVSPGLVNSNIHEASLGRPPALAATGMLSGDVARTMIKQVLKHGVAPDEVGAAVIDGIGRNAFHIFTHPGFASDLQEVHEDIMTALPHGQGSPALRKMEDDRRRSLRATRAMAAVVEGWGSMGTKASTSE